uniref:Uncharacterized protein n=1 Tax=Oryza rufipogon TaxID=4529 RepID=A0A0E0QGE1_ORYRU
MATMQERVEEVAAEALGNLDPVVSNLLDTRSGVPLFVGSGEAAADNLRAKGKRVIYDGSIGEHVKRAMCRVHILACHNWPLMCDGPHLEWAPIEPITNAFTCDETLWPVTDRSS